MEETAQYKDILAQTAQNITNAVKAEGGSCSSWELKLKLHLSSSSLYLALGWLAAQDKITLYPKELNFRIVMNREKQN